MVPLIKRLPLEPDVRARAQQLLNEVEDQADEQQALHGLKRAAVEVAEAFFDELEKQNLPEEAHRELKHAWESVLIQVGKKTQSKARISAQLENVMSTVQEPAYAPEVQAALRPFVAVIKCWT